MVGVPLEKTEENPLIIPGNNNLKNPVLLRLLCGAVSPVETTRFWAPVSGFLDQFILNHLCVVPEASKETLKIHSSVECLPQMYKALDSVPTAI